MKLQIKHMLAGMSIGIANIIPGVSGGTMMVILGIFDPLIETLGNIKGSFKKSMGYLVPILLGAIAGILLFSSFLKFLLDFYPMEINFLFLGLIAGSIPMIYRRAKKIKGQKIHILAFLLPIGIMAGIAVLSELGGSAGVFRTVNTIVFLKLFIGSAVAAICMILPGISGSMMLMVFGLYETVLTAITQMNIAILIPVVLGILLGIGLGAKGIGIMLKRYPQIMYSGILGLVFGSMFTVFENAGFAFSLDGMVSIVFFVLGGMISYFISQRNREVKYIEKETVIYKVFVGK